jgi:hypothetical protein
MKYPDDYSSGWGYGPYLADSYGGYLDIPVRYHGQLDVSYYPVMPTHAASKAFVEDAVKKSKYEKRVVNCGSSLVTREIPLHELKKEVMHSSAGEGYLLFPTLPPDTTNDTQYTITVKNYPEYDEYDLLYWEMTASKDSWKNPDGDWFYPAILHRNWGTTGASNKLISEVGTCTGPWYINIGGSSGESALDNCESVYLSLKDCVIEYSYQLSEDDITALSTEHTIDLFSDEEVHYDIPIKSLTINTLIRRYPKDMAQEWCISFIAGDEDPIITLPSSADIKNINVGTRINEEYNPYVISETLPVEWIGGVP